MPKFVDDLHVAGAVTASANPAVVTHQLQKAVGQVVDVEQYLDTDGTTVKGKVDANFIATFQALIAAGLTGATSAARYVGATSSGAPASGTFLAGDWVISKADAKVYVCTSGGTPGTWTAQSAGAPAIANMTPPTVLQSAVYRPLAAVNGTNSPTNFAAGLMQTVPFVPASGVTLNAIGIEVTTAGAAGSLIRLGIYSDNGAGYPGALLTEFTSGTQIDATTTGVKELTISQALTGGTLYWLAYVGQVGIPLVRCTGPLWGPIGATSAANAANASGSRFGWSQSSVTGAMPANFTTTKTPDLSNTQVINIYGKAA